MLKADGEETHYYDGRSVAPKRLSLDSAEIITEIRTVFGEGHHYTTELMDKYDTYYISRAGKLPLPVWRIAMTRRTTTPTTSIPRRVCGVCMRIVSASTRGCS